MTIHKVNKLLLTLTLSCSFLANAEVKDISSASELKQLVNKSKKPVVAKLYTDTCPACVNFEPLFEKLAKEIGSKAVFVKVDLSNGEVEAIARENKVGSIPTTLIFNKSMKPAKKIVGGNAEKINEIKKAIESLAPVKRQEPIEEDVEVEEEVKAPAKSESKGALKEIGSKEEFDELVASGKSVVVKLDMDNCKYCVILAPVFEQLAKENPDVVFLTFNKKDTPEFVEEYGFNAYPSFLIFKDGKFVQKFTGGSERSLPGKINSALGKPGAVQFVRVSESEAEQIPSQAPQKVRKTEVKKSSKKKTPRRKIIASEEQY